MSFSFVGYFPKRIEPATEAMGLPDVDEIWSLADCISEGPENWITFWRHNDFGAYNTSELARSVVPADRRNQFAIVAYRLWSEEFDDIGSRAVANLESLRPIELDHGYRSIGFDAVSASCGQFECSPLSCNGGAKQYSANRRCLFRTLDEALAAASEFARGGWEPGPYRVVEVLAPQNPDVL
jgi:hypothetical protein